MPANGRPVCLAIFSLLLALLISAQPGLTLFFRDTNATGFNRGTFQNTIYNSSIGAVALNRSDATNKTYASTGNFTSRIFDAGSIVEWSNISWAAGAPYGLPLPSGQRDELAAGVDGGANMSGNVLLLNFDEPDGSKTFGDLSGTGNNASCAFTAMCPMRNDSGVLSGSLSFNVTNSTVIVNQSSTLDVSQVTVEAWVRLRNMTFTNVSALRHHACALTNTGEVYCWGLNDNGQLGDGTTKDRPYAVKVLALANATMISVGGYHSCATTTNGTAFCWGYNAYGQLGDGTWTNRNKAVVSGWGLNFTYISAGAYSTCGVVANGSVYCWGRNNYGQLGDGTTTDRSRPSNVTDSGYLNFSKVSISQVHACGISTNGTVYCWGRGARGALGTNATSSTNTTPVEILIKLNATEVKAGGDADEEFSCAIATNGTIYCWGVGGSGRLGTGDSTSRNLSTAVAGSFNATAISLSYLGHGCALTTDRKVYCWGLNSVGQLGDGTISSKTVLTLASVAGDAVSIGTGYFTCAVLNGGQIACWGGTNEYGALGFWQTTRRMKPTKIWGLNFTGISTPTQHGCGVLANGSVYCWGYNNYGQVGDGTTTNREYPVQVSGQINAASVEVGRYNSWHTCAILTDRTVKCWGYGGYGQLGNGLSTTSYTPVSVLGLSNVAAISLGDLHTCGLRSSGDLYCWGANTYGQLGDGTTTSRALPVASCSGLNFSSVTAGSSYTCGIVANGTAYCWGYNAYGQLGNGSTTNSPVPRNVTGSGEGGLNFTSISAGNIHTCGIVANGTAYCWGYNVYGQLGNGSTTNSPVPRNVTGSGEGGLNFTSISAGFYHTCGVVLNGTAYCWGWNGYGQLGEGTTTNSPVPRNVTGSGEGGLNFTTVSAGLYHTCGITLNGTAYCWGQGTWGALGTGVKAIYERSVPVLWNVAGRSTNTFGLYVDSASTIQGIVNNQNVSAPAPADQWTHLALTYDGSGQKLYIDGVLRASAPASGEMHNYDDNFTIGSDGLLIDELAVFNRSLSAAEIYDHYMRGAARLNVTVRSCNASDCSGGAEWNVTYNLSNASSVINLSLDINRYFQYRAFFATLNSSFSPVLYNVTMGYRILDYGKPDIGLYLPADNHNTSSQAVRLNFTATDNMTLSLINCSVYLDGVLNQTNASVRNNTLTGFDVSGLVAGNHSWNVTCSDEAGNANWSATRIFYVDRTPPAASTISLVPNSSAEVDPNTLLNVTANVTDDRMGVDTAVLQYKLTSEGEPSYVNRTTYLDADGLYRSNFTTAATDKSYNYRACYNDTFGNFNCSTTYSVNSYVDYTWDLSPSDLGTVLGFIGSGGYIGTLYVNNTGDESLGFTVGSDYPLSIYFNGTETSKAFSLAAGANATVSVTARFSNTTGSTTTLSVNLSAATGNEFRVASPTSNAATATLIAYSGGPYLLATVVDYPASATHGSNISLNATVKNVGNETANQTWINWSLASGMSNSSGMLELAAGSMSSGASNHSNVTVYVDPASVSAGAASITLKANCTNCTEATASVSMAILCSGSSDGVCGSGCTYKSSATNYDPDCPAPSTTVVTQPGGGGTVLAGGGALTREQSARLFKTSQEEFELVRGTDNYFTITISNPLDQVITNVTVDISGYISAKLSLDVRALGALQPGESRNVTVYIDAPEYLAPGRNELVFAISGRTRVKGIQADFSETRTVILLIQGISRAEAVQYLDSTQSLVEQFTSLGFPTGPIEDLYSESLAQLGIRNYDTVKLLNEEASKILEDARAANSTMAENTRLMAQAEHDGIPTPNTMRLNNLAVAAFQRGEFALARSRAEEATMTYALETKGEFNFGMFIYNNLPQVSVTSLASLMAFLFIFFRIKLSFVKHSLKILDKEEVIILGLIKQVQKDCFEKAKMSMEEYVQATQQYEDRLGKAVRKRVELESRKIYLSRWWRRNEALYGERDKLLELIKGTQSAYMEHGTIETHIYERRMLSLRERLSEVEEKIAMKEAREAIKKRMRGRLLRRQAA